MAYRSGKFFLDDKAKEDEEDENHNPEAASEDDDVDNDEDSDGFIAHEEEEVERTPAVNSKLSDEELRLCNEDLELVRENVGEEEFKGVLAKRKRKVKPRARDDDVESDDEEPATRGTVEGLHKKLFQEEEPTPTAVGRSKLIIQDDDDEEMEEERAAQRKKQDERLLRHEQEEAEYEGETGMALGEDEDLEEEEGEAGIFPPAKMPKRHRLQFEPIELKEAYMTSEDMAIRMQDQPERVQLKFNAELREQPEPQLIDAEADWIYTSLYHANFNRNRRITEWTDPILSRVFDPQRAQSDNAFRMKDAIRNVVSQLHFDTAGGMSEDDARGDDDDDHDSQELRGRQSGAGPREVPFIAQHRKELAQFPHVLNVHDLWLIDDFDVRFSQHMDNKDKLLNALDRISEALQEGDARARLLGDAEKRFMQEVQSEDSLRDCSRYLAYFFSHDSQASALKRKNNRDYHFCNRLGITKFVKHFGVTATDVADILVRSRPVTMTPDHQGPDDAAVDYAIAPFDSIEKVVDKARYCFAIELAMHPEVKTFWRERILDAVREGGGVFITTRPTRAGFQTIDPWDRYAKFTFLTEKPIFTLRDDVFLWMEQAVAEKKLELDMFIDGAIISDIKKQITDKCQPDPPTMVTAEWQKQFEQALDAAHERLAEGIIRELKIKLREEAKMYVTEQCANYVRNIVNRRPVEPPHLDSGHNVAAMVLAPVGTRSFMVVIGPNGDVLDHLGLDWLHARRSTDRIEKFRKDLEQIKLFLAKHQPYVVGLGADSVAAKYFTRELSAVVDEALQAEEGGPAATTPRVEVELMPVDMALVYASGRRSAQEFPKYSVELKMAISIARRMQAPEIEMAGLFGPARDILCIQMNPLQKALPQDTLFDALYREVMVAVNRNGVRINSAVSRPHLAYAVEFVCGLGPRKADKLLNTIRTQLRGRLSNRKQLSEIMEPCVAYNAASFILVDHPEYLSTTEEGVEMNRLDMTRIHPERYTVAIKIAMDAVGTGHAFAESIMNEEVAQQALLELQEAKENPFTSENLVQFAKRLQEKGEGDLSITIHDIYRELLRPLKEDRHEFLPMRTNEPIPGQHPRDRTVTENDVKLFFCLTGQAVPFKGQIEVQAHNRPAELYFHEWLPVDYSVVEGQLIDAQVTRFDLSRMDEQRVHRVMLRCTNDLPGYLMATDVSDDSFTDPRDAMQIGQMITARVLSIEVFFMRLKLTAKGSELRGETPWYCPASWGFDEFYDEEAEREFKAKVKPQEQKRAKYTKRMVTHPNFHNVSYQQALSILEDHPEGDGIFRPSSRDANHLTLTWKVMPDMLAHVSIEEDPKYKDTPESLSSRLIIRVGETALEFEDLDEILFSYVNPSYEHVRRITSNRKYFADKTVEEVAELLIERKKEEPKRIPYMFSPRKDRGCCFWLSFLPGQTAVRRWHLYVLPTGYTMNNKKFSSLNELVAWFKRNFQKLSVLSKQRDAMEERNKKAQADTGALPPKTQNAKRTSEQANQPAKSRNNTKPSAIRTVSKPKPRGPGAIAPPSTGFAGHGVAAQTGFPTYEHLTPTRAGRRDDYDAAPRTAAPPMVSWGAPAPPPPPRQPVPWEQPQSADDGIHPERRRQMEATGVGWASGPSTQQAEQAVSQRPASGAGGLGGDGGGGGGGVGTRGGQAAAASSWGSAVSTPVAGKGAPAASSWGTPSQQQQTQEESQVPKTQPQ